VLTIDALLQLRVDVHRHLRIRVPDLAHHPEHVEPVGQQRDRDVRAPQRVRRRFRQSRKRTLSEPLRRELGGFADDLGRASAAHPATAQGREQVRVRLGRAARATQVVQVGHGLRLAWYTTPLLLDTDEALAHVAARIEGLDAERALADLYGDAVDAAYRADRDEARRPSQVAVALRRTACSDGRERHAAPTLVLHADDGRAAVVPGSQPFEAADVALMNLSSRASNACPCPS
jgi:hypothetical protein